MEYKFKNPITTSPSDVEPGDVFGFKVVAVVGYADDWAAYIGPLGWSNEDVAERGDKLSPEQADPLFYVLRKSGRTYRL